MKPERKPIKKRKPKLRPDAQARLARAPHDGAPARSGEELLHQLQVHQIELETQNVELRRAQRALEQSRDRYADLYDFAPVAYLSLTRAGAIAEANLSAAALLGLERGMLPGRRFTPLLAAGERERWERLFRAVMEQDERLAGEFALQRADGSVFHAWLDCLRVGSKDGRPALRIALSDITERKRAEESLRGFGKRLRVLTQRMIETENAVRRKINRELHDRVGAGLAAISLSLSLLRSQLSPQSLAVAGARIEDAQSLLEEMTAQVRDLMADLHPPALDDYGLYAALRTHVEIFGACAGVPISLRGEAFSPRLPLATETALFRVAQGALANAVAHARAKGIEVRLAASAEAVTLSVADDGIGFDLAQSGRAHASWGLDIMRERAEAVGAELTLDTAPGKGTRVCVRISREQR